MCQIKDKGSSVHCSFLYVGSMYSAGLRFLSMSRSPSYKVTAGEIPPAMSIAAKVSVAYVLVLIVLDVLSGCDQGVGRSLVLFGRMSLK